MLPPSLGKISEKAIKPADYKVKVNRKKKKVKKTIKKTTLKKIARLKDAYKKGLLKFNSKKVAEMLFTSLHKT